MAHVQPPLSLTPTIKWPSVKSYLAHELCLAGINDKHRFILLQVTSRSLTACVTSSFSSLISSIKWPWVKSYQVGGWSKCYFIQYYQDTVLHIHMIMIISYDIIIQRWLKQLYTSYSCQTLKKCRKGVHTQIF